MSVQSAGRPVPLNLLSVMDRGALKGVAMKMLEGVGVEREQDAGEHYATFHIIRPLSDEELGLIGWNEPRTRNP